LRLEVLDEPGVLAEISRAFAEEKVSIAGVKQKETVGKYTTLVIVLHETNEANLESALQKIGKLKVVKNVCNVIRVGL
jgi:homoserine dehydrogenase